MGPWFSGCTCGRREGEPLAKAQGENVAESSEWVLWPRNPGKEGTGRVRKDTRPRPKSLRGRTVGMALAERLLLVRTREGWTAPLKANAVQRAFERRRGERNIVLKARQLGLTTWAAARFFLKTITQPGTVDGAGGAHPGGSRGDFPHRAPVCGVAAGGAARRATANLAGQCAADRVSEDGRTVPGGDGRRPKCGAGIDGAEPALLGAGALAGRSGRDTGGATGDADAGGGTDSGIDARWGGRMLLRRVAEGPRDGDGAALFPLVDGAGATGLEQWTRQA